MREKLYFLAIIKECIGEFDIEIYAYCIMSNHAHFIIKSELEELSGFMAKILAKYAEYYNYKHQRNGHVFQNRFKSECIEDEKYFWNCVRYIHLNPVKAGIVKNVLNHKYSSIKEYQTKKLDILSEKAIELYQNKYEDWEDFINYHNKPQKHIFEDIKEDIILEKHEVAMQMLFKMQREHSVEKIEEILEDIVLRGKYKEKIKETFAFSSRETDRIYESVKKEIFK